ncbi:hypothetical protein L7F22_021939 [Adiantum nelumboides]|nr:hypothetical protein [Adiantum nelumboides]
MYARHHNDLSNALRVGDTFAINTWEEDFDFYTLRCCTEKRLSTVTQKDACRNQIKKNSYYVEGHFYNKVEVELEILQSQVDHAKVHLAFTENMLVQLKEGQSLCLAPKPYQAPTVEEHANDLEGQCTGCGEPLATPCVAAMYMMACKHKYHPLCFASLLASGHACSSHCCSEPIPESMLALLGGVHSTTDYESRKFCIESLFTRQRLPTSEGLDRTTGSIVVTNTVEVMYEKNSAEEMEKALMVLAAEDGVNAVQKMMEQATVEEIKIDRVPLMYKNPSKYINVKDPSRPTVLIDLQGVLIYSHFIRGKEAPPDLDANEHIQVEEPPYCYFVRENAEQFLVLACYFANMFIWSSTRLRNVEIRVQRLFPNATKWLSGLIGQELCDVANFNLSMGIPIFFKNLLNFWCKFPHYNEGDTLLIDDNRYTCALNRPGTYLVVPKERKKDWLINDLGVSLLKWKNFVDRLAFAEGQEQPLPDQINQIVW